MGIIKGQLQASETNDWGYPRVKVSGTWYGADAKVAVGAEVGALIEFDAYQKPGKNGKSFNNYKAQSLKVVKAAEAGVKVDTGPVASKDEYWSKKEANDLAKEPRISYFAAVERAIQFTELALANGAFEALSKAKPVKKLEILEAFVAEQAHRLMVDAYSAEVPSVSPSVPAKASEPVPDESEETEEEASQWS